MKTICILVFVVLFGMTEALIGRNWNSVDNGTDFNCTYQSCSSDRRSCHCDSYCTYFRDCCEDYESDQDTFVSVYWKHLFPHNDFLQCRSIPGYWKEYHRVITNCHEDTYWMVSRCPPKTSKTLIEQCETEHNINNLVKVSFLRPVHDNLGTVFKNLYCAKCHDIPEDELTFWSVDQVCLQCPEELALSQDHFANLSSIQCDVLINHSVKRGHTNDTVPARLRWCNKDMIRSCPAESNFYDKKMCSKFMSPGYYRGSYFKNIFCARCNGLKNTISWSCEALEDCEEAGIHGVATGLSFSDSLCSLIRCSRQYHLCDARETRQYIAMFVDDIIHCAYAEERAERCFFQKAALTNAMLPWKRMVGANLLIDANETRKHNVTVFKLPGNVSRDWRINLDKDLVSNARRLIRTERSCYLKYIKVIEVCSKQEWKNLGECPGELVDLEGDNILDDKDFLTKLKLNFSNEMLPVWYAVNTRIPFRRGTRSGKRTYVCFAYRPVIGQGSIWYKLFSGVCIAIAIVGHLATFFTYVVFKPLRNTFGVSLMSFVISLALSLCLQAFVNDYVINVALVCKAVAIVSHFFWLASFTWMNVLAWDLRATLSLTKLRVRKPSSRRRLFTYCCFGWCVPLLVVSTCVILWWWNLPGLSINYGPVRDYTCWLSDDLAVVAAIGGPLVLCLTANVLLFIMVARSLYKHKKSSKVLDAEKDPKQHKSKIIELMVYVKISTLMGFSWIFGILADFTKTDVLWWFSNLSYLIQAVTMFVFFGLSPRVRKMWKSSTFSSTRTTSAVRMNSQPK